MKLDVCTKKNDFINTAVTFELIKDFDVLQDLVSTTKTYTVYFITKD